MKSLIFWLRKNKEAICTSVLYFVDLLITASICFIAGCMGGIAVLGYLLSEGIISLN